MELLEYKNQLFDLLNISQMSELPQALESADNNLQQRYIAKFGLDRDWIRELYQYYLADREGLKQDYTPESLARLLGAIIGPCNSVIDLCAGSGSLSLHTDPKAKVTALELDSNVLPFLKFNLSIHGREAEVIQANVLNEDLNIKADRVISNPPFNLNNQGVVECCRTGNWAFVYRAWCMTKNRACIILPNSVLNETKDKDFVSSFVQSGYIEAVIGCPERMFASTSIPVCVLVLNRVSQKKIVFIDGSRVASKEIREQKGQIGESCHTGRVYKKELSVFDNLAIEQIVKAINEKEDGSISKTIPIAQVAENGYHLNPKIYLEYEPEKEQTKLEWIAERYNSIVRQKNACKLTINETLAKGLGFDKGLWEQQKKNSAEVADMIQKVSGVKLETEDYLTFTKSRELTIRFKSKEVLPEIFTQFMQMWVNRVVLLNNLENEMLAQMRDYLLPLLLSGEIEVPPHP